MISLFAFVFIQTAFSCLQNTTSNKYHLGAITLFADWSDMTGMSFIKSNILYSSLWFTSFRKELTHLSSPQLLSQPATPVLTTCAVRWAAPTCATQSKSWMWCRPSPSTHSNYRSNPLTSPQTSLLQVIHILLPHVEQLELCSDFNTWWCSRSRSHFDYTVDIFHVGWRNVGESLIRRFVSFLRIWKLRHIYFFHSYIKETNKLHCA